MGSEGNADVTHVLQGKTFSNSNDVGISGTMVNRGKWTSNTSNNGNIVIPQGYHDGTGYVACAGAYNAGVAAGKAASTPIAYLVGTIVNSNNAGLKDPQTFVCTMVPEYKSLTIANFVFKDIRYGLLTKAGTHNILEWIGVLSLSYTASTGTLTISNTNLTKDWDSAKQIYIAQASVYAIPNIIWK